MVEASVIKHLGVGGVAKERRYPVLLERDRPLRVDLQNQPRDFELLQHCDDVFANSPGPNDDDVSADARAHSTVTDLARLRGLSTSLPRASAVWYASSCSGTTCRIGDRRP